MAIALLIIFTLLFIGSFVLMPKGILRTITYIISLIIMAATMIVINAGDNSHYGMKKVTTTEIKEIKPISDIKQLQTKMLILNPLGTKKESIVLYKNNDNKTVHTQADQYTDNQFVRRNNEDAHLRVSTTKYLYKNNFFKFLYAGLDNNNVYKSRKNEFIINKDWVVLTPKQAKELQANMKKQQKQAKPMLEKVIKQQLGQAMAANPSMNKAQQKQLTDKITKQAQQQGMKKSKQQLQDMSVK